VLLLDFLAVAMLDSCTSEPAWWRPRATRP
jgi:hypothetical protein